VAKGKFTGGRQFKKGQVGNPLGGGAHNPELKKIRKLTNEQVAEVGSLILTLDAKRIDALRKKKEGVSILQTWIANAAYWANKRGDVYALNTLLDRISGKIKETKEVKLETNEPQVKIYLPDNGRGKKSDNEEVIETAANSKKVIDEIIGEDESKP